MGIILWSLKTYGGIIIRLKAIKYKLDIACYLPSLPSGQAIKPSRQAH